MDGALRDTIELTEDREVKGGGKWTRERYPGFTVDTHFDQQGTQVRRPYFDSSTPKYRSPIPEEVCVALMPMSRVQRIASPFSPPSLCFLSLLILLCTRQY